MKKILGISLCALFAVSAANANIASQEYVDEVVGAIDTTGIGVNAGNITALDGRVTTSEEKISTLEGKVSTNETNIAANAGNITTLTGRVDGHDTSIAGLTQQVGINEGKINTLDEDIQAMDLTATTGDYVKVVSQSNGSVQATGASFDDEVTATSENAPTSKAVAGYVATNAVQTVVAGDTNGTIKVDGAPVAVTGLQAMAYKAAVTNLDITDETITNADISPTAAILSSKISFTREQSNALNSGITSDLVGKITTNETNIASNATNIESMGTQVTTNTGNITDLQGRMTTAEGKITNNSTLINSILNATGATTCDDTEAGCTLVLSSAGLKWETVKR